MALGSSSARSTVRVPPTRARAAARGLAPHTYREPPPCAAPVTQARAWPGRSRGEAGGGNRQADSQRRRSAQRGAAPGPRRLRVARGRRRHLVAGGRRREPPGVHGIGGRRARHSHRWAQWQCAVPCGRRLALVGADASLPPIPACPRPKACGQIACARSRQNLLRCTPSCSREQSRPRTRALSCARVRTLACKSVRAVGRGTALSRNSIPAHSFEPCSDPKLLALTPVARPTPSRVRTRASSAGTRTFNPGNDSAPLTHTHTRLVNVAVVERKRMPYSENGNRGSVFDDERVRARLHCVCTVLCVLFVLRVMCALRERERGRETEREREREKETLCVCTVLCVLFAQRVMCALREGERGRERKRLCVCTVLGVMCALHACVSARTSQAG